MKTLWILGPIIFVSLIFGAADGQAEQQWGPWEVMTGNINKVKAEETLPTMAIRFFQKYLTDIDGARCSMYPTCSTYALQAVKEYGFFLGSFIFVDRLYHEGDPVERQTPIVKHGYIRFHDPLENNTFWLNQ